MGKKYKPYSKFDEKWIGRHIHTKKHFSYFKIIRGDGNKGIIVNYLDGEKIFPIPFRRLLKAYLWEDGSVCGEEK